MRKPGINMTMGVLLLIVSFGVSAAALWGGAQLIKEDEVAAEANGGGGGGATGGPVQITVIAESLSFDPDTLTASPGVEVTITMDNRDAGVQHNVAFYTDRSAASAIYVGGITVGPSIDDFVFTSPSSPGSYFLRCDVHPDQMTGVFNVQ